MLRLCTTRSSTKHYLITRTLISSPHPPNQIPIIPSSPQTTPSLNPPVIKITSLSLQPRDTHSFFNFKHYFFALSATLLSLASFTYFKNDDVVITNVLGLKDEIEGSTKRVMGRMKQTGVAASVLYRSLKSVLEKGNQEVRLGFELRVAALLADIVAADGGRRKAIVGAGGGAVVDWLLESLGGESKGAGEEAARALAYLIGDEIVCGEVIGRPGAVKKLLRFIFSSQPKKASKDRRSSLDSSNTLKGRSMLVAAIMDIVTSNCDSLEKSAFRTFLPVDADVRDIAAAIEVIEEGCMHFDGDRGTENGDDDGERGIRGIGMRILGGTSVVGLTRTDGLLKMDVSDARLLESTAAVPETVRYKKVYNSKRSQENVTSLSVPGLWDDLQCEHVAVPFATWALANWALASERNRARIQELDRDGHAIMTALMAPERTVKWHGSLVARLLLEDRNLPLMDSVTDWSSSLLSTAFKASNSKDIPLAQVALSAFLISVERSPDARKVVTENGLHQMRGIAKQTLKHEGVQETLAKALELLSTGDLHLSLEESQKWSSILLDWACGKFSLDSIRDSAIKILFCILEDYGPYSVPISQGWLAILLNLTLTSKKAPILKGSADTPKSGKVQTQINQANVISATQILGQLATAVISLAGNQLGRDTDSTDTFPLKDLLTVEPFAVPFKNMKKDKSPKFDAADSALATLKGIKALTGLCMDDSICQNKLANFGVLCLLRRFLLRDDYEKLAANEAYDASKIFENQERVSNVSGEEPATDPIDSSVRVPPTAHIRRHAARLLNILSLLPKIQKAIVADKALCMWLDDCAKGRIPGCHDLKIKSYARAILLNTFCSEGEFEDKLFLCSRYEDMIFLINPDLPHWKCSDGSVPETADVAVSEVAAENPDNGIVSSSNGSNTCVHPGDPLFDIVFIHGLRGGPFKTWRLGENKVSTTSKSGLVEKIDQEAGKEGTFWPQEWLATDFPHARLFSVKYKTNLTQWSGTSLPLQEVSSMLLKKLVSAGIGDRPVVFVTHSMGGLVVKQMLYQAKEKNINKLVNNTVGVVFYSCPHFGSKLADMPWRMGLVLRPAPTIGELRSGSPVLVVLNDFIRQLHKKGSLNVLSFCETQVTPIVEGYGGWAFRLEIVAIESAYPGFGELVVLDSTDHINSCKPLSRADLSYKELLEFLQKLKGQRA